MVGLRGGWGLGLYSDDIQTLDIKEFCNMGKLNDALLKAVVQLNDTFIYLLCAKHVAIVT